MRAFFHPKRDADGSASVTAMSIEEYHRQSSSAFNDGFDEVEVGRSVRQFGASVNVWSTY
ncbi:hypothetical protein [Duganella aceris]|uniref:Uncharacterized protein n=1 Tax=Duganella aceris TaxID=2703883 RepID=A0ABX0FUH4_9BURK|nr:hypothetical protein [Duganella aceris]NGZ88132.1 hypothetical protein [Duganella aceris]